MKSEPWMDTAKLRASLPLLKDTLDSSSSVMVQQYLDFYGLRFDVEHTHVMGTFQSGEFQIVGQIFRPMNPVGTLFVYHGYFDHLGLYRFLVRLGLEVGLTVVGHDLPGHGLSSGQPASIPCFSHYAYAQKAFVEIMQRFDVSLLPRPWSVIGQSTGAAVVMDSLLEGHRYGVDTPYYDGGLVFLAPLIRPLDWYLVRVLYQLLRHRGSTPRTFKINSGNQEFSRFLSEVDPLQHRAIEAEWVGSMIRYAKRIVKAKSNQSSVLIIQGTNDQTVAARFNVKALSVLFPNMELVTLEGARHQLVNESEEYLKQISKSVKVYLKEWYYHKVI